MELGWEPRNLATYLSSSKCTNKHQYAQVIPFVPPALVSELQGSKHRASDKQSLDLCLSHCPKKAAFIQMTTWKTGRGVGAKETGLA